jgi:hypothetical protein
MKKAVFWDVTPCNLIDIDREEKHTISIVSPEDGDSMFSETLASTDDCTRRQNPEHHQQPYMFTDMHKRHLY